MMGFIAIEPSCIGWSYGNRESSRTRHVWLSIDIISGREGRVAQICQGGGKIPRPRDALARTSVARRTIDIISGAVIWVWKTVSIGRRARVGILSWRPKIGRTSRSISLVVRKVVINVGVANVLTAGRKHCLRTERHLILLTALVVLHPRGTFRDRVEASTLVSVVGVLVSRHSIVFLLAESFDIV